MRMAAILLAAALVAVLGGAAGGDAARLELPRGWICNNSLGNLSEIAIAGGPGRYRVLKIDASTPIQSENSTFALAFVDLAGHGDFYLSVVLQRRLAATQEQAEAMPVWVSNQSSAIGDGGFLMLTARNGKLILLDNKRSFTGPLWTLFNTGIVALELQETGNLIFYGNSSSSSTATPLWQSFDDPTDVLLPGQELKTSMVLTSRTNESSLVAGTYQAVMHPSGLVLGLKPPAMASDDSSSTSSSLEPYLVWSLSNLGSGLRSAAQRCGSSGAVLVYKDGSLKLEHNDQSLPCSNSSSIPVANSSQSRVEFLKLTADGDLISFIAKPGGQGWIHGGFSLSRAKSDSSCRLPLSCGPYGICQIGPDARCRCLVVSAPDNESFGSSEAAFCAMPKGVGHNELCENEQLNHHMLDSSDTGYFSTPFVEPDIVSTSLDDCKQTCLWNCSCSAAFFDTNNGRCFFVSGALVGSLSIRPAMIGSFKFRNAKLITGPVATQETNKGVKVRLAVGALSTVAVLLLAFLLLFVWKNRIRRRRERLLEISRNEETCEVEQILNSAGGLPQRFTYAFLEAATEGFSRKLGVGGFGSVYEGRLPDGNRLAVKKLEAGGGQGLKQFVTEIASMGSVSHINVVKLCGFCIESSHRLLVYEYMPNGSLDRWLFNPLLAPGILSWQQRVDIALGMAKGLAYLHEECREPIIHLDVKSQNILLDEKLVPKVADFGMAKLLSGRDVSQVITCVRGTPGYLAPEWLTHSIATKKCDVYSYGMVLLELLAGRKNVDPSLKNSSSTRGSSSSSGFGSSTTDLWWYFPAWAVNEVREGRIMGVIDERIRDSVSEKQARKMVRLALWCIQENPSLRPGMIEVVEMLERQLDVEEPPMSFHFAVQTTVGITASRDSVSMAYVNAPSYDTSSLIR